jgi:hypothetical protein
VAGFCTGCNTSANCYTNSGLFPEACLQTPLSDQERALEFMFFDLTSCVTSDTASATPAALLTPKTFSLDFVAKCPAGTIPRWREFDYQASFPAATAGPYTFPYAADSINFAAQTSPVGGDGGAFLPATPLQLGAPVTTTTPPATYVQLLLDTGPKGTAFFSTATPRLLSQTDLRMWITLTPTADELSSPTLTSWKAQYDCPVSE